MGAQESSLADDPCDGLLEKYLKCVQDYDGVAPSEYDTEYCEEHKGLYVECRKKWAKEQKEKGNLSK